MDFTIVLVSLSLYVLIWEKLPDWGTWFNRLIDKLPGPLAYLYQAWRCPYCFGFWAALCLQWLTGIQSFPGLYNMPEFLAGAGYAMALCLDALGAALLIMLGKLVLSAIAGPAIKGYEMTQAFKKG